VIFAGIHDVMIGFITHRLIICRNAV
jgi:hypothetical protein